MKELEVSNFFSLEKFPYPELWKDIVVPWAPLLVLKPFFDNFSAFGIHSKIPSGVNLIHSEMIFIGKGCTIFPGATLEGPCIIGDYCQIRPGAWVRPYVLCLPQSVIGHNAEIKHSLLFSHVRIPHTAYIGDSIIGAGANIGAGVTCSNLRLDQKLIVVSLSGRKIPTPLKKMGAIIGEKVQVGCHTMFNPGTLVGKKSLCYPSLSLSGWYPPNSCIKTSHLSSRV